MKGKNDSKVLEIYFMPTSSDSDSPRPEINSCQYSKHDNNRNMKSRNNTIYAVYTYLSVAPCRCQHVSVGSGM